VPEREITINYYALDPTTNTWTSDGEQRETGTMVKGRGIGVFMGLIVRLVRHDGSGNSALETMAPLSINAASADISQACIPGSCPTR